MTRIIKADLIPNTAYKVQVRAVADGQYSEWSESFTFTTAQNGSVPAAPATVTWTVQGDGFLATWTEVTQDVSGNPAVIISYELELTAGATVKTIVVPAQVGQSGQWALDFQGNTALFGTPQPSISLRVRAVNNKGIKGNFSGSINAQNPVPANVAGFTATGGQNVISLSWTANTDADLDHYEIFTGSTAGFTPSAGNRIFAGLATSFPYTSTTYSLQYFKIRAIDKFGQASATDAVASATPTSPFVVDTTAPATPTALAGTITNNANGIGARIAVTWTMSSPPSDLAGFNLRYRKNGDTNWQYMNNIDSADRAATLVVDLAYTAYDLQIQAFDFSDNRSAWSSTATAAAVANTAPANVTGLTSSASSTSITYTWTAVADQDIKNYEVTFSTSSTFASGNITFFTGNTPSLTVNGLTPATTYYARVRAVDTGGLTSAAFSATDTRATAASTSISDGIAPSTSPAATVSGGLGYLFVNWTAISNADAVTYEVHISTTTGFTPSSGTKVAETSATNISLEKDAAGSILSYGTTYYIKLIAKDRDGSAAAGTQGSGTVSQVGVADVGAGAITTNALASNSVTANKLGVVVGGGNIATNTNNGNLTGNVTQGGATLSTDATVPGIWVGSTSSIKVNLATTAFSGFQKQNFTLVPNTTYTWSAWVKLPTTNFPTGGISLAVSGAGVTSPPAGTAVTTTGSWQRATLTFTTNATATPVNLVVNRVSSSGVSTEFFNLDAMQLEPGDVPTAYAPKADEILPGTISGNMILANFITGVTFTVGASGFIQSSNYSSGAAGWRISTTGLEMNDSGSTVKADAIKAGTLGGSGGSGIIQVAAGTSINMNGGYIKSNTNTGTTMATAVTSGSGFYLGNDGLFVGGGANGGQIKANALISDTITSTTITLGSGGSIVGGSWTLNSSGLTIPNGGISAASLSLQKGENLVHPAYADFEWDSIWYPGQLAYTAGSGAIVTTDKQFNSQSLQWTTSSTTNSLDLSPAQTTHNMIIAPSTTYLLSAYVMVKTGNPTVSLNCGIRNTVTGGSTTTVNSTTGAQAVAANSTWTRYTWQVTSSATATGPAHIFFTHATTGGIVYLDGLQLEEKWTNSTTPSTWTPPSTTTIDGGMIRTGSIQSPAQYNVTVNGNSVPLWSIPTNGAATFANLQVRGSAIIGVVGGADGSQSNLSSANYVLGTTGWQVRSDGSAEFNGATLKGGAITGTSFATDVTGQPRVEIADTNTIGGSGGYGFITFYGDGTENVPGKIYSAASSTYGVFEIDGPRAISTGSTPIFVMESYPPNTTFYTADQSDMTFNADSLYLNGRIVFANPSSDLINSSTGSTQSITTGAGQRVSFTGGTLNYRGFSYAGGSLWTKLGMGMWYHYVIVLAWDASNTTGFRGVSIWRNSAVYNEHLQTADNNNNRNHTITGYVFLNSGDTVEARARTGTATTIAAGSSFTLFPAIN